MSLRSTYAVVLLGAASACTTFGVAADAGSDDATSPSSTPPGPIVLPDGAIVGDGGPLPPRPGEAGPFPGKDAAPRRFCFDPPAYRCADFDDGDARQVFDLLVPGTANPDVVGSPTVGVNAGVLALSGKAGQAAHAWYLELPTPNETAYTVKIRVVAVTDAVKVFRAKGAGGEEGVVLTTGTIAVVGPSAPAQIISLSPPYELTITPSSFSADAASIPIAPNYFRTGVVGIGGNGARRPNDPWSVELDYVRVSN